MFAGGVFANKLTIYLGDRKDGILDRITGDVIKLFDDNGILRGVGERHYFILILIKGDLLGLFIDVIAVALKSEGVLLLSDPLAIGVHSISAS